MLIEKLGDLGSNWYHCPMKWTATAARCRAHLRTLSGPKETRDNAKLAPRLLLTPSPTRSLCSPGTSPPFPQASLSYITQTFWLSFSWTLSLLLVFCSQLLSRSVCLSSLPLLLLPDPHLPPLFSWPGSGWTLQDGSGWILPRSFNKILFLTHSLDRSCPRFHSDISTQKLHVRLEARY